MRKDITIIVYHSLDDDIISFKYNGTQDPVEELDKAIKKCKRF
jgi:hypothetical protein